MSNLERKQLYRLDEKAVEELLERYRTPLLYFIMGFLKDCIVDAEDVLSETVVKLLIKKPVLRNEKALKSYLYTTAKHIAITHLRKQKREKEYLKNITDSLHNDIAYIEDQLCNTDEKRKLATALRTLPENYRQVLYLSYFEDLSIPDICKILGKSKKQVYNLLARAKTALAEILKKEDGCCEI